MVVLAVLAPLVGSPERDGYPLSTYPMFARDGGDTARIDTVVGRGVDEERHRLSPELIAGSDEPVLAAETVRFAVRDGTTTALCAEVAARLDDAGSELVAVEVVTEAHDLDRPGDTRGLLEVVVHERCPVTP